MIDKAVILAAGLGNRISKVAGHVPKPLLPLDGQAGSPTFLDWHLWSLGRAGVKEIFLVGNQKTFGTQLQAMRDVKATWILNPTEDISTSGSGHSAQFAWHSPHNILDGKSRVILMDADILYEPSIYALLADAPREHSKTLVCSDYRETDEEVMVFAPNAAPQTPFLHGKGLLGTPLTEGAVCLGEATGILLWEAGDHDALRRITDWTVRFSTAKARSEHEDITQRMMSIGRVRAVGFGRERAFMECDTPEEYEVLKREMYPRLRGLLR
jgi:choline kinase